MKKIIIDGVEHPVLIEHVADDRTELHTGEDVHSVPNFWWRDCGYWITLTTNNHTYNHPR